MRGVPEEPVSKAELMKAQEEAKAKDEELRKVKAELEAAKKSKTCVIL